MNFLTPERIQSIFKPREVNAHKGDFGHALLIAGNTAKMGAAVIASRACLRSGVGLLNVCVPKEERGILQTSIPEAMLSFREEEHVDFSIYDSIGMGPGMGISHENSEKLREILLTKKEGIVLDADALMLLSMVS
jgi:NAD(P)H-hydrate repair Nnr-like enzyme with NAD(P)H-hydrate dehydratase domain